MMMTILCIYLISPCIHLSHFHLVSILYRSYPFQSCSLYTACIHHVDDVSHIRPTCRPDPGHPCHEVSALTTTTHMFIFSLSYIFPIHIKPLPGGNYTKHYTTWFKLHCCFGLSCIHFLSVYLVSNLYPSKEGYLAIHFYYRIND